MCRILIIPLLASLLFSAPANAKEHRFTQHETFEPDGPVTLALTILSGSISITGESTDRIEVELVKVVDAVGMDQAAIVADHIKLRTEESGNRIDLSTAYLKIADYNPDFWDKLIGNGSRTAEGDVEFRITVPEKTDLVITSTSGPIKINNVTGNVTISTSDGAIDLNTVQGEIQIDNGAGTTRGELLFGPVEVRQPIGEIGLKWVEGDIRVKSLSAKIDVLQETGALDIVTRTGPVTIRTNLESNRDFFVETQSGNIEFLVPVTASGLLHISSELGEIQTDVPISIEKYSRQGVVGRFGVGGVNINLVSGSGDVTVAQF